MAYNFLVLLLLMHRTFSFNEEYGDYGVVMMVPLADMLNDNSKSELQWDWDDQSDQFTVHSKAVIKSGVPVRISYGQHPDW